MFMRVIRARERCGSRESDAMPLFFIYFPRDTDRSSDYRIQKKRCAPMLSLEMAYMALMLIYQYTTLLCAYAAASASFFAADAAAYRC